MRYLCTFLIAIAISCVNPLFGQNETNESFEITNLVDYDKNLLTTALENCQLDRYRKMNSRSILRFEDGTQVSLLSVKELEAKGIQVDETMVLADGAENNNTFRLRPNGYIMELIAPAPSRLKEKLNYDKKKGGDQ